MRVEKPGFIYLFNKKLGMPPAYLIPNLATLTPDLAILTPDLTTLTPLLRFNLDAEGKSTRGTQSSGVQRKSLVPLEKVGGGSMLLCTNITILIGLVLVVLFLDEHPISSMRALCAVITLCAPTPRCAPTEWYPPIARCALDIWLALL